MFVLDIVIRSGHCRATFVEWPEKEVEINVEQSHEADRAKHYFLDLIFGKLWKRHFFTDRAGAGEDEPLGALGLKEMVRV